MIVVVTGLPGAGKTLHTLTWLKAQAESENRQVYYDGVKDLKLPWIEHDPKRWMDLPPNSIMLIDEAQRVFRPRANGSAVPDYVAALETHRHQGLDIVLITQHPNLLDQNVRRLCGRHIHVMRIMGMPASTIHEWPQIKENCDKNRSDSSQSKFIFPKDNYALYHSAEVHTHKVRLPKHLYVLAVALLVFIGFAYRLYSSRIAPLSEAAQAPASQSSAVVSPIRSVGYARDREAMTPLEYVQQYQPRVQGLAYTAPAYDGVTRPVRAPYPAACVQGKSRCQCYTQQGTKLETDKALCEGIVAGGFFVAWDEKMQQERIQPAKPAVIPTSDGHPLPGLINATPGYTPSNSRPVAEQVADGQNLRHGKNNRIPG